MLEHLCGYCPATHTHTHTYAASQRQSQSGAHSHKHTALGGEDSLSRICQGRGVQLNLTKDKGFARHSPGGFNSACNFINVSLPFQFSKSVQFSIIFFFFSALAWEVRPALTLQTIRWRNKLNLCASAHDATQKCCQRHWQCLRTPGRHSSHPMPLFSYFPYACHPFGGHDMAHLFYDLLHTPFPVGSSPFASINKFCKCAHKTYEIAKIYFISQHKPHIQIVAVTSVFPWRFLCYEDPGILSSWPSASICVCGSSPSGANLIKTHRQRSLTDRQYVSVQCVVSLFKMTPTAPPTNISKNVHRQPTQ